jgi:hypothetical protein
MHGFAATAQCGAKQAVQGEGTRKLGRVDDGHDRQSCGHQIPHSRRHRVVGGKHTLGYGWQAHDEEGMEKTGYSWFVEDEPTAEVEPVVAKGGVFFLDKEEAAIDQHNDCDDMEDELECMMEDEGMTVDIRAMMEEMERSGVLMYE